MADLEVIGAACLIRYQEAECVKFAPTRAQRYFFAAASRCSSMRARKP